MDKVKRNLLETIKLRAKRARDKLRQKKRSVEENLGSTGKKILLTGAVLGASLSMSAKENTQDGSNESSFETKISNEIKDGGDNNKGTILYADAVKPQAVASSVQTRMEIERAKSAIVKDSFEKFISFLYRDYKKVKKISGVAAKQRQYGGIKYCQAAPIKAWKETMTKEGHSYIREFTKKLNNQNLCEQVVTDMANHFPDLVNVDKLMVGKTEKNIVKELHPSDFKVGDNLVMAVPKATKKKKGSKIGISSSGNHTVSAIGYEFNILADSIFNNETQKYDLIVQNDTVSTLFLSMNRERIFRVGEKGEVSTVNLEGFEKEEIINHGKIIKGRNIHVLDILNECLDDYIFEEIDKKYDLARSSSGEVENMKLSMLKDYMKSLNIDENMLINRDSPNNSENIRVNKILLNTPDVNSENVNKIKAPKPVYKGDREERKSSFDARSKAWRDEYNGKKGRDK